jgi:hypothetical protein
VLRGGATEQNLAPSVLENLPWTAQIAMRAAVQPWIDEPIDYPLLVEGEPDPELRAEARRQAAIHGLGSPAWRSTSRGQIAPQCRNEMCDRSVEPAP